MSATVKSAQPCPAWCNHDADFGGFHLSEVHEVGEVMLSLGQHTGELPAIELFDQADQEMFLSLEQAEQVGAILLELARAGRKAARRAAA